VPSAKTPRGTQTSVEPAVGAYRRWESDARFVEDCIVVDLLGDVVLMSAWGGLQNHLHGQKVVAIGGEIPRAWRMLEKRRLAHGYLEKSQSGLSPTQEECS
jgi:hypothetical protein